MPIFELPQAVEVPTAAEAKKQIVQDLLRRREPAGAVILYDTAEQGYLSVLSKSYYAALRRLHGEYARTLDRSRRDELEATLKAFPDDMFRTEYRRKPAVLVLPADQADSVPDCTALYVACDMQPAIERLVRRSTHLNSVVIYRVVPTRARRRRKANISVIPKGVWRSHHVRLY